MSIYISYISLCIMVISLKQNKTNKQTKNNNQPTKNKQKHGIFMWIKYMNNINQHHGMMNSNLTDNWHCFHCIILLQCLFCSIHIWTVQCWSQRPVCKQWVFVSASDLYTRLSRGFTQTLTARCHAGWNSTRSRYYSTRPRIARFMGPTGGPSGADRTQVGPMLAPWT